MSKDKRPKSFHSIHTVVFINNAISCDLVGRDLERAEISLSSVAVILGRDVEQAWISKCAVVLRYGGRPASTLLGQRRFVRFFRSGAKLLRQLERAGTLRAAYVVNNDNLLSAHILDMARRDPSLQVTVVAEGLMNFQDITVSNRASWRWRVKPLVSAMLGLRYRKPTGHLSGADDPVVGRVITFSAAGMKAPPEKVRILPFVPVSPKAPPRSDVGLIVHTGLWAWMSKEDYLPLAEAFAAYVRSLGFQKLYAKPHPRIDTGVLTELLPDHELWDTPLSLEALAPEIEAATILGTCCTGLVTLKLIRPDLRCVDFGGDYYCHHAYNGDRSVLAMMRGAGVEIEPGLSLQGLLQVKGDSSSANVGQLESRSFVRTSG